MPSIYQLYLYCKKFLYNDHYLLKALTADTFYFAQFSLKSTFDNTVGNFFLFIIKYMRN